MHDGLSSLLEEAGVPGAAAAVIRQGEVVDVVVAGCRCPRGALVTEDSVWEAASLTKPVVAYLVLKAVAEGCFDLDESLSETAVAARAAPDPRLGQLTARHVLSHHTGFPNWRVAGEPLWLLAAPGARFGYSGEGFDILLRALAASAPADLPVWLDDELQQLGMCASSFTWQDRFEGRAAVGHEVSQRVVAKEKPAAPRGAGSLHVTPADYGRFVATMLARDDRGWLAPLIQPAIWLDESNARTLGMALRRTARGDVIGQHGDNPGFKHLVLAQPATGDGVVVFTNGDGGMDVARRVTEEHLLQGR